MTRFQTKALPSYTPERYQSPIAGIWQGLSMWYSLPARVRNKIADWFTGTKEETVEDPAQTALNEVSKSPAYTLPTSGSADRGPAGLNENAPVREDLGYNGPRSWDEFEFGKKLAAETDPAIKQAMWDEFIKGK